MTMSDIIRAAIKRDGRSASALAKDSGVSKPQITRFILGQRTLTLPNVEKLCEALGLGLLPLRKRGKAKGR